MQCRGIRGATTVGTDTVEDIVSSAKDLLREMIEANGIQTEKVASVIFTTTSDLNAAFPAVAARQLGWTDVALLCCKEMDVPGSLPRCLRILVLYNTEKNPEEIVHVYTRGAVELRSDLSGTR